MKNSLTFKNLYGRLSRTVMMIVLSFLMALTVISGTLVISGLKNGISSLEDRLGADIMVVPNDAASKQSLSKYTLQGNSGEYYMKKSILNKVRSVAGVKVASEQYVLATISASCCSSSVKIIGFNPDTDFTIKPWIKSTYTEDLGLNELIVGADLSIDVGDNFKTFGTQNKVVAKMAQTGTYLDQSVYASMETIDAIITNAEANGTSDFEYHPDTYVSDILVDVIDGYDIDTVVGDIKLEVATSGTTTVKTQEMMTEIAGSLSGINGIITTLVVVVWALSFIILTITFVMVMNERKKEFAIIRVAGASKSILTRMILKEAMVITLSGGIIGTLLGAIIVIAFKTLIEDSIGMPFLIPSFGIIALVALLSLFVTFIAGIIATMIGSSKINKADPAIILREDN